MSSKLRAQGNTRKLWLILVCSWALMVFMILRISNAPQSNRTRYSDSDVKSSTEHLLNAEEIQSLAVSMQYDEDSSYLENNNNEPNETALYEAMQRELHNVPFDFWRRHKNKTMRKSKNCAEYPDLKRLQFHNTYWQNYQTENVSIRLFSAYYDCRPSVPSGPVVRVLVMSNHTDQVKQPRTHCQLWYDDSTAPSIVAALEFKLIWYLTWGKRNQQYYPYLVTCALPPGDKKRGAIPQSVSLTTHECDTASNNLRVVYETRKESTIDDDFEGARIGVCVKGLEFPYEDISTRLVEWLEMMRLLGVHKVFTYELAVHKKVSKVLRYYQDQGFLDVSPLTLGTGEPSMPNYQHWALKSNLLNKRLNELIPYNDCFYRNMYKFDYLAVIDIDEVIMPLGNNTDWSDLIEVAERQISNQTKSKCPNGYAGVCMRHVHFPHTAHSWDKPIAPRYMYMLQHTQRMANHSKVNEATKCLHNTTDVLTLHNHFSISRLKTCKPLSLDVEHAQLHHYRSAEKKVNATDLVEDNSIWLYASQLLYNTEAILEELGLLS